jgi:hypothetical protein
VIGIFGMAAFAYLATVIDVVNGHPEAKTVGALTLVWISWFFIRAVLDVGALFLINSMRFFVGQGALPSGKPGWIYLSAIIAFAAFFVGGLRAARVRRPDDAAGAARAAVSTLVFVVPILFVISLFWSQQTGDDVIAAALLLPIVWGAASALGGLYHANQASLPPGILFVTASRPAATPPPQPEPPATIEPPAPTAKPAKRASRSRCPNCGAGVATDATFCSACGTRLR